MALHDRRSFLAASCSSAVLATAGCLGILGSGSGSDTGSAYHSYGYDSHNRGSAKQAVGPTAPVESAWRLPDALVPQTPVVLDGTVYVATDRRGAQVVVAVDAETGDELWEYDAGSPLGPTWHAVVDDGTLYFLDHEGGVHAVATDDGSETWQRSLEGTAGAFQTPLVVDGAVVFCLGDIQLYKYGGLYALETSDGSTRWHRAPSDDPKRPWTSAVPAGDEGTVYLTSFSEPRVTAVDAADGEPSWSTVLDVDAGYTGVAVTPDRLYLGGALSQAAVDRDSRTIDWVVATGSHMGPPTVAGDRVVVGHPVRNGPGIHVVGATGTTQWKHGVEVQVTSPGPRTVADETVYYGAADGRLYALDLASGDVEWRFGEQRAGFWTPIVVDETVYVASSRGLDAIRSA